MTGFGRRPAIAAIENATKMCLFLSFPCKLLTRSRSRRAGRTKRISFAFVGEISARCSIINSMRFINDFNTSLHVILAASVKLSYAACQERKKRRVALQSNLKDERGLPMSRFGS